MTLDEVKDKILNNRAVEVQADQWDENPCGTAGFLSTIKDPVRITLDNGMVLEFNGAVHVLFQ